MILMSEKTISPHELHYIQSHRNLDFFNYELAKDWAISLIHQGIESDNILMLASFHQPIDSVEIRPFVSAVLREMDLEELEGEEAIRSKTLYHVTEISNGQAVRKHLDALYGLCLAYDYHHSLMTFYSLHFAWKDLEEIGDNYYYPGATLENIEEILKTEARNWIELTT